MKNLFTLLLLTGFISPVLAGECLLSQSTLLRHGRAPIKNKPVKVVTSDYGDLVAEKCFTTVEHDGRIFYLELVGSNSCQYENRKIQNNDLTATLSLTCNTR